jgi:hypothetical protein
VVHEPYEGVTLSEGLWREACRAGLAPSEFEELTPAECYEVFAGAAWRLRTQAVMTAWFAVALEHGTKDMKPLEDLLGEGKPQVEVSKDEYYRTLRRMGLK